MCRRSAILGLLLPIQAGLGCAGLDRQDTTGISQAGDARAARARTAEPAPSPRISPVTHIAAGQMLERQGDFAGAIDQYERAIATTPRHGPAYNRLAILYGKLNRQEESERFFKLGVEADPESATLRNNLGYTCLTQDRLGEAESQFRAALALSADFKRARMNLAITLARLGRFDESVNEFVQVVPQDVAHYNVGVICLDRRDYATAEQAFREALAINSESSAAQQGLEQIRRLAGHLPSENPQSPPPAKESIAGVADDEEHNDIVGPPAP